MNKYTLTVLLTSYFLLLLLLLLSHPLLSNLVELWQVLTGDVKLMKSVILHLLEVISLTLPYQEKARGSVMTKVETAVPKAVSVRVCLSVIVLSSLLYI